jgi:hypothetical protein
VQYARGPRDPPPGGGAAGSRPGHRRATGASAPVEAGHDPIQAQAATNTPGDAPANVTPSAADATVENGRTCYQGQVLYGNGSASNEPIQVREVFDREDGEVGDAEPRAVAPADTDGEFLVDTSCLATRHRAGDGCDRDRVDRSPERRVTDRSRRRRGLRGRRRLR